MVKYENASVLMEAGNSCEASAEQYEDETQSSNGMVCMCVHVCGAVEG